MKLTELKAHWTRWTRRLEDGWHLEALSISGSLASLLVMVILLSRFDRSQTFHWYGLTLNTIISILATASKGWLIFAVSETVSQWKWVMFSSARYKLSEFENIDNASRGPLGCFQVLAKRTGGLVLAFGASITILAIAIDPLAQQLLSVQTETIFTPQVQATIATSRRYAKGAFREARNRQYFPDYPMQAAFITALSASRLVLNQQLPFNCPTGNCKWQAFQSLAICSSCQDLGDRVAEIVNGTVIQLPEAQISLLWNETGLKTYSTTSRKESAMFSDNELMFWSTSFLQNRNGQPHKVNMVAAECMLQYCVREYNSIVINGTLHENSSIVSSASRASRSWMPGNDLNFFGIWNATDDLNQIIIDDAYGVIRSDLMVGDGYNVSQTAILGMQVMLQNVLMVNNTISGSVTWDASMNTTNANPFYLQPLFDSDNFTGTFETIAMSMSNALRAGADAASTISAPSGEFGTTVSIYVVRWPWIGLPLALVIFGFIFLWLGSRYSRGSTVPVWKSCPIAIISMHQQIPERADGLLPASVLHTEYSQLYAQLLSSGEFDIDRKDLSAVEKSDSCEPSQQQSLMESTIPDEHDSQNQQSATEEENDIGASRWSTTFAGFQGLYGHSVSDR